MAKKTGVVQKSKAEITVLQECEKIINASLTIMDELPHQTEGHALAEQIRELVGRIEDGIRGQS